jgi:hypothetical protein
MNRRLGTRRGGDYLGSRGEVSMTTEAKSGDGITTSTARFAW